MDIFSQEQGRERLVEIEQALVARARDLALFLVYDRPSRVMERPGLERTYFAQRCVSDAQLEQTIQAFREVGAYVELFEGERPFLEALATGRIQSMKRALKIVYNGIGWGIGPDGFQAGRKALIPLIADSYGIVCANSEAYACALTLHKFHSYTLLKALGIKVPMAWFYGFNRGWIGERPPRGTRVIAKSTYEAWAVGVSQQSVFTVDDTCDERVSNIMRTIGQSVTVQEFIPGADVLLPVWSCPQLFVTPPMVVARDDSNRGQDSIVTLDDNLHGTVQYRRFDADVGVVESLHQTALRVFEYLDLLGFTRIDFRLDSSARPWVIDIAVSPGLGEHGSGFRSVAEYGFDHHSFIRAVIAATLATRGLLSG